MKRSNPRFFSLAFVLRRGQILLPSLFVIPSLLIFVYLLFETTKISREKIRQQFAVDSASFIQMGDYTNLLNRTAYVNGPFPHRIFRERYSCPPGDKYGYDDVKVKGEEFYIVREENILAVINN